MVYHDQERIKSTGKRKVSDQVDRELLERTGAGGGEGGQCGNGRVGINLHLLAKGATSNETADKQRHTRPPVVARQQGVCVKEAFMSRSEG